MRYEGPIYRPPSEADSLLIQATVGCPWNKCTFCMVYKKGPPYKVRPVKEICEDMVTAYKIYGPVFKTLFFPAGNTIAMPTKELIEICSFARKVFPYLERITVYGSSRYIAKKGMQQLKEIKEAGLDRIHVGLESGNNEVLRRIKKGTTAQEQIKAGRWVKEAGMQLSEYVILGLGGKELTKEHGLDTAKVINEIEPDFVRLRTLVPKINTLLLHQIKKGKFKLLSPHEVLRETRLLIENIECKTLLTSDHYTNYINLEGRLPQDKERLLREIDIALTWPEDRFRPFFIGTE
ncbi:MAG: radical SAM protein [Deltaproteobacteria bacterium]|nr:MAG: radical SAM protein [Deltaproteobacteria bacterium]